MIDRRIIVGMPGKKRAHSAPREKPDNHIRTWRDFRGLTLEGLAELAGLSAATVSNIETKKADFTGKSLFQLSRALNTTPGALLHTDPNVSPGFFRMWQTLGERDRRVVEAQVMEMTRET